MMLSNKRRFISALVCLILYSYEVCVDAMPMSRDGESVADIKNKKLFYSSDLHRNYETFSRNAVAMDTIVSPEKDKYVSINNGRDFNIPIDDSIKNFPIGTYQYIDSTGDLHIVNFINDSNGLKILNDYKPFPKQQNRNKLNDIQSVDSKLSDKEKNLSKQKFDVMDESDKDINYDEYEFTFMPQEMHKSENKSNNKMNDLNLSESNRNVEKAVEDNKHNMNNNRIIHRLTEAMNSIPLPQPFSVPNHSESQQYPNQRQNHFNGWSRPPIPQNNLYGIPLQESAPDLGFQRFPNLFNWNYNTNP